MYFAELNAPNLLGLYGTRETKHAQASAEQLDIKLRSEKTPSNHAALLTTRKSEFSYIPSVHLQNIYSFSIISWYSVEAISCCYTLIQYFETKITQPNQTGD